jgi:hypothetical protein
MAAFEAEMVTDVALEETEVATPTVTNVQQ